MNQVVSKGGATGVECVSSVASRGKQGRAVKVPREHKKLE